MFILVLIFILFISFPICFPCPLPSNYDQQHIISNSITQHQFNEAGFDNLSNRYGQSYHENIGFHFVNDIDKERFETN